MKILLLVSDDPFAIGVVQGSKLKAAEAELVLSVNHDLTEGRALKHRYGSTTSVEVEVVVSDT